MMASLGSVSASSMVEKATSHLLIGPDWAMNLEICDMTNTNRWQTKEVVKAIRKRLQNKHSKVQFLALTLLETMMKNCGPSIRFEVAEHEVLPEMIKIVRKQTDFQVRDKALILLDSWQEAFGGPGGQHPQYYWAYIELKRSGVQFPRRAPDAPLTFTNATSASSPRSLQPYSSSGYTGNSQAPGERGTTEVVNVSMSELHNMRSAMELLTEMLRAVNPHDRAAIQDEVITDLVSQCKSNQNKLVQLINSTGDEQVLAEALTLNDSLQNVIAKNDAIASGTVAPEPAPVAPPPSAPPPVEPTPVVEETKPVEDEDDEFAQIAQRKSKGKGIEVEASSSQSDVTVEESVASNALVVMDPPPPTEATKQQDMIDLLTLALYDPNPTSSDNTTPTQPATTFSPTSTTAVDPNPWALVPVSSPASPPSSQPQPTSYYPYNQGYNYNPYGNYVAPWAQPTVPPTQTQYYPSNPYAYPSTQYQAPPVPAPAPAPAPAPMQRFNSFGGAAGAGNATATPVTAVPFSSSGVGNAGTNASTPALKKELPAGSKPYYMPDNLFGDLVDIKNFGTANKASNNRGSGSMTGSPGQPMVNSKK